MIFLFELIWKTTCTAKSPLICIKNYAKEFDNIGIVIQAYLYRTEQDMNDLHQYQANLRLVKGAYKESPEVSFPEKKDVDENYKNH